MAQAVFACCLAETLPSLDIYPLITSATLYRWNWPLSSVITLSVTSSCHSLASTV